jgi:hypothetical protein
MQRSIPKLTKMTAALCMKVLVLLVLLSGVANATLHIRYVRSTGSNANNGLSPASAWQTIQHALNTLPPTLANGDDYMIDVGPGIYFDVRIPVGWPSAQSACAISPGAVTLVLKGPAVNYTLLPLDNIRYTPVSPICGNRVVTDEAIIRQVSGRAAIEIGEGTDVEVRGFTVRNFNNQAIFFDSDQDDPGYICASNFPDFNPAARNSSRIVIRHNIIETGGTTTGNSVDDGIVGIYNGTFNGEDDMVFNYRTNDGIFDFHDNLVRDIIGIVSPTTVFPSVGLNLENCMGDVRIWTNLFQGRNANTSTNTMTNAVRLFGCKGIVRANDTLEVWVRKNRIENTSLSGINVVSENIPGIVPATPLTTRFVYIANNSILNCNSSNNAIRGGIEVDMNVDVLVPGRENTHVQIWSNVIRGCRQSAIVYNGFAIFPSIGGVPGIPSRRFAATHNIFIDNNIGAARGAGIRMNNYDLTNNALSSTVDAAGNWWGDNRGPYHLDNSGMALDYNRDPRHPMGRLGVGSIDYPAGNQQVRTDGTNAVTQNAVFYSPWLAGTGNMGAMNPDDMQDMPCDTASWGFNNMMPKNYIAKELQDIRGINEANLTPEDHTEEPDMLPIPQTTEDDDPSVSGYVSRAIAIAKNRDTINVLAGTFNEILQVSKDLVIRGPMAGMSASCNSVRELITDGSDPSRGLGIGREAKITSGRFGSGFGGPVVNIGSNPVTIDGLAIYAFTSMAINKPDNITSNAPLRFRNLIIRTMNLPGTGNSSLGLAVNDIFAGGGFISIERHDGNLWIQDNKFENIIASNAFNAAGSYASSTCITLLNCSKSTWVQRNYMEGDPTVLRYEDPAGTGVFQPTRIPMAFGMFIASCNPTGMDSTWVTSNYIYRADYSGILITDRSPISGSVRNVVVRHNTIDQANLSLFSRAQDIYTPDVFANPNETRGGIEMVLGTNQNSNIRVMYNHFRNNRNACIFLRQAIGAPAINVPAGLVINYNLFNNALRPIVTRPIDPVPYTATIPTPNAGPLLVGGYTYTITAADAGISCAWTGTGNVDGRANWWGTNLGPRHAFNVDGDGTLANPQVTSAAGQGQIWYSPWLAGPTLTDDVPDTRPVWNPRTPVPAPASNPYAFYNGYFIDEFTGRFTNLNFNCSTWGYQDTTPKSYYVEITSPGIPNCQPQQAIGYAKDGDKINIRDVSAFQFEDLFVNKNIILDADNSFGVSTRLRDIHVLNGKRVQLNQNYIARNINLSCPVNVMNSCINLGPQVGNGYIETYTNPAEMRSLTFEGQVCEQPDATQTGPDRYVRGQLITTRRVAAGASNNFGGAGFVLGTGPDNLGDVMVTRFAGPDILQDPTNPNYARRVTNTNRSINRVWAVTTQNPYTAGTRNVEFQWYAREDNNNSVLLSRPWYRAAGINNNLWTGVQPSTVSSIVNPRVVRALGIARLTDSLTIAENSCNIVAELSRPSMDTICAGQSVNFDITINGGFGPYDITYTENGVAQAPIRVQGPGSVFRITLTPNPTGPQDRTYRITQILDVTGCRELNRLGAQRNLFVKPTPTAKITGTPAPVCNNQMANFRIDFTGNGPWRFMYRVTPSGPVQMVTTSMNPHTLMVTPPNNVGLANQDFEVTLLGVDYGAGTCMGTIVDAPTRMVSVRPSPTATYVGNTTIQTCACQPANLDVLLTGQGPWIVEYTIGSSTFQTPLIGSAADPRDGVNRFFTVFPNVINPVNCPEGPVMVKLTKITDASGCTNVPAGVVDVTIDWRPQPSAAFNGAPAVDVCSNSNPVCLDVEVRGRGPWTVNYIVNGITPGFQQIGDVTTPNGTTLCLPVTAPLNGANLVTITGVIDGFGCSNAATFSRIINVNPRPTIGFVNNDMSICAGQTGTLQVSVTGRGPWTFAHTQNGVPQSLITVGTAGQAGPQTFSIPVSPSSTTSFVITSITDGNIPACNGTVIGTGRTISVNPLPTASLLSPPTTVCAGTTVNLQVFLTGRGPWTLGYTANGVAQTPVVVGSSTDATFGVFRSFQVIPNATTVYTLTTVSDGSSPMNSCTNIVSSPSTLVTVNPAPSAAFTAQSPIATCQGSAVTLPIAVSGGRGPWIITYTITGSGPAQTKTISVGNSAVSTGTFNINEILLNNSNITINSVTDGNNCTAMVAGAPGTAIAVLVNAAPTAVITGGLQVACQSAPVRLTVSFTGSGPWTIKYRENSNPPVEVSGILANPFTLLVNPTSTGTVVYTLTEVSYGPGGCVSTLVSGNATVQVNPTPTANFTTGNTTICSANAHGLGLILSGRGPWTVYYNRNGVADSATLGTAVSPTTFPTVWSVSPMMNTTYTLTGVKDGNGCRNTSTGNVTVTVNPTPTAMWTQTTLSACVGTTTNLPLSLTGRGPWTVQYLAGTIAQTVVLGTAANSGTMATPFVTAIAVSPVVSTTYVITNITDSGLPTCLGGATGSPLTVNVAAQPSISIMNVGPVPTVCANTPVTFMVTFTGTAPWDFRYTDGTNVMTVTGVTANPFMLTYTPMMVGATTITPLEVSYGGNCRVAAPSPNVTGGATVVANPASTGTLSGAPAPVCLGGSTNLVVNLTGTAPWNFSYTVNGVSFSRTNVFSPSTVITVNGTLLGTNLVQLTAVSDASACPGTVTGAPISFQVNQGPSAVISAASMPTNVCLGASTMFTVNLTGTAPWNLTVVEGPAPGTTRTFTATTTPFMFSVTPTALGARSFNITSVTDASGCTGVSGVGTGVVNVGSSTDLRVLAVKSDVVCAGSCDGRVTVTGFTNSTCGPNGNPCPIEYSIDGGATWQTNNTFTGLCAGMYTPLARLVGTFCAAQGPVQMINQPTGIGSLTVSNITINSANISWGANNTPSTVFYEVQYRALGEDTWTVAGNNIVANNFSLTGLQNNTIYEVRVRQICNGTNFSPFVTTQFNTLAAPGTCPTPGGVFINNIAAGTATVNWNPTPNAVCYIIQWRAVNAASAWNEVSVPAGANNQVTLTNLGGTCNWNVRVRVNCSECNSTSGIRSAFTQNFTLRVPNPGCARGEVVNAGVEVENSFRVYPNPTSGNFTVTFQAVESGATTIQMLDLSGKVVIERSYNTIEGTNELPVDMLGFAAGAYVLKLQQGESIQTAKVILN